MFSLATGSGQGVSARLFANRACNQDWGESVSNNVRMIPVSTPILPPVYERGGDGQVLLMRPAEPCPELLTEEEAIRYLRLDAISSLKNPSETLERYRAQGKLRGTQVGRMIRYRRIELERFLEKQTDQNPR